MPDGFFQIRADIDHHSVFLYQFAIRKKNRRFVIDDQNPMCFG